jgi:alpha-L-rhamnosidase
MQLLLAILACAAAQTATRLRVEYLETPLTIDEPLPRFSFALDHPDRGVALHSYQLTVATTGPGPAAAAAATSAQPQVVWDSGRVVANSSLNIEYAGAPLTPDTDYAWSATWWSSATSAPSMPARTTFSTALLGRTGAGADWVAPAAGDNLLRAEFAVLGGAVVRARLYISGLGYYKSWLNGAPTDAHVMGSFTVFEKRVLYDVWDVTPLVHPGCNALAVALGRGWYNQSSIKSGPLSLWALLTVDTADGRRASFSTSVAAAAGGASWTSAPGPVVFDEIYLGEHYDARLVQPGWSACAFPNASAWRPAVRTRNATADAAFVAHAVSIMPDLELPAVSVSEPRDGVFVLDFSRNMAGIATVRAICPDGPQTIRVDYAETLKADGTINQVYNYPYPLIMTSNFTCAGTGELEAYTTWFSQYGFQYAQVTNFPGTPDVSSMTAFTVNSAVGSASTVETSNVLLNRVQRATRAASISNLMDVPTDCPQRERRGWLGDAQVSMETVVHNFDAAAFYKKWLDDVADAQFADGRLADCAPYYYHGGQPADPGWSAAYPLIVRWASSYYSDERLVGRHYAGVRAFVEWQTTKLGRDGLLPLNTSQGVYGDWCHYADGPSSVPHFARVGLTTYYYIQGVSALASFAATLGKSADAAHYAALAAATTATYHAALWNATAGSYEDGYPVSQLAALDLGGASPTAATGAFAALVAELETGARSGAPRSPTGGIVFQKLAYPQLAARGRMDLALDLLLAQSKPSVGYWLNASVQTTPASTLWERWIMNASEHSGTSFNHIMYGGYGGWLYSAVGGLGRAPGSASWTDLDLQPPQALPATYNLSSASVTIDTAVGFASVAWWCSAAGNATMQAFSLSARVPTGGRATVRVPIGDRAPSSVNITESGNDVWRAGAFVPTDGVTAATAADGYVSFAVGSGTYEFELLAAPSASWTG